MKCLVIPTYKSGRYINDVISDFIPKVDKIIIVEDKCPDATHRDINIEHVNNPDIYILINERNLGVGGATICGIKLALELGADIIIKVDSDRQMSPKYFDELISPIQSGIADYTKGNRFASYKSIESMPRVRVFGNAVLTILNKISSGYWSISDPCNGYIAMSRYSAKLINYDKISFRYFFETDMLHFLYLEECVVRDVSMEAIYGDEISNIRLKSVIPEFLSLHTRNFLSRIWFKYFLEGLSVGSLLLISGLLGTFGSIWYNLSHFSHSYNNGIETPPGVIAMGLFTFGFSLILIFLFVFIDIKNEPKKN